MQKQVTAFCLVFVFASAPSLALAWGHEGHQVIALIAEKHMNQDALAKATNMLDGSAIDGVAS